MAIPLVADPIAKTSVKADLRVDAARGAAGARTIRTSEHKADDIVEVRLDGGVKLLSTLEQFLTDYPPTRQRGGAADTLVLPMSLDDGMLARGGATTSVKSVAISALDLSPEIASLPADIAGRAICAWFEKRQLGKTFAEGISGEIWKVKPGAAFALEKVDLAATTEKVLLFIHGTASSSEAGFGKLWADHPDMVDKLFKNYADRVYAFEHYSLTQSPIRNAIDLAGQLPERALLHIVSHSRGGLVGELICRAERVGKEPLIASEVDALFGAGRERDRDDLAELNRLLTAKKITVERFVRVACPARGTTLASRRLDRWLSLILNVLGFASGLEATPAYQLFEKFAKALIKARTKPDAIPGLEAQMPESPLIALINSPEVTVKADLHVIAGDIEGNLLTFLGVLLTDVYYWSDHDLVVNTAAMYGGAARQPRDPAGEGARYYFDQGSKVNHFRYFLNDETAKKLSDGLLLPLQNDGYTGFRPETGGEPRGLVLRRSAARSPDNAPIVVMLPGIMGSCLAVNGEAIWPNVPALFSGGLAKLAIEAEGVSAVGMVGSAYAELADYLAVSHQVEPFPYDWRLSLVSEAKRFATFLEPLLEEAARRKKPLVLLAHSMGGLLARVMIANHPATWAKIIAHPQGRLIMLGTPNGGSYTIPRMLMANEPIIQGISLVDIRHSQRELLAIVSRYPGALEMLPVAATPDFFSPATWAELERLNNGAWVAPEDSALDRARKVRTEVLDRNMANPERIVYVAGCARETPLQLRFGPPPRNNFFGSDGEMGTDISFERFYFEASARGDGRVLWDGGIPGGVKTWYSEAAHGDLAAHQDDFPALRELIETGATQRLRDTAPQVRGRSANVPAAMSETSIHIYPDQETLEAVALGRGPKQRNKAKLRKFSVTIGHGNLQFARNPVTVGHYQGDTIIGAEAALDRQFNGRLTDRHRLQLYPGPLNTAEVFLDPDKGQPGGAIVVGLGRVGELTPGRLQDSFARAILSFALVRAEQDSKGHAAVKSPTGKATAAVKSHATAEQTETPAAVSTLLIGTGAGALPIRDSLASMLRGVADANASLKRAGFTEPVYVDQVEIIELYEDRAVEAALALVDLQNDPELASVFDYDGNIKVLRGHRRRVTFHETPGWWERLQVVEGKDGELVFTRLTDRARTELSLLPTQRTLVDRFIEHAVADTGQNNDVARTLFELLVPNALKEHAPDRRDLVLVVDDRTAQYPWELMQDGLARTREGDLIGAAGDSDLAAPLAVRAGLIRQRITDTFREQVAGSTGRDALVVGNPLVQNPAFPSLDGAREEARSVDSVLRSFGYAVSSALDAEADEIVRKLFQRPYRVVHLAGHGVYEYVADQPPGAVLSAEGNAAQAAADCAPRRPKPVSGMVIGDGVFLTPKEIRQMRTVPELVFINCCFSGMDRTHASMRDRNRLAGNISTQLIENGVRAVVCAGWAVDDAAAQTFAEKFYQEMLGGTTFGKAVKRARALTYGKYPNVNTWGAYQCYGDPDCRLYLEGDRAAKKYEPRFSTVSEAIAELENINQDAATASAEQQEMLVQNLQAVREKALAKWPESGALLAALGRAYGELDNFGEAIKLYEEARSTELADFDLSTLEQLANIRVRHTAKLWQDRLREAAQGTPSRVALPPSGKTPEQVEIDAAHTLLDLLLQWGKTAERYALLGSLWKRAAVIAMDDPEKRKRALREMVANYATAHEINFTRSQKNNQPLSVYPLSNWLLGRLLSLAYEDSRMRSKEAGEVERSIREWLPEARLAAKATLASDRDFWSRSALGDSQLIQYLVNRPRLNDEERQQELQILFDAYSDAIAKTSSPRERRSVSEHLDFVADMAAGSKLRDRADIAAELRRVRDRLFAGGHG